jgi:hypothetical protein
MRSPLSTSPSRRLPAGGGSARKTLSQYARRSTTTTHLASIGPQSASSAGLDEDDSAADTSAASGQAHTRAASLPSGGGCWNRTLDSSVDRVPAECRSPPRLFRKPRKIEYSAGGGRDSRNIGPNEVAVPSDGGFRRPGDGGVPRLIDAPEFGPFCETASADSGSLTLSRQMTGSAARQPPPVRRSMLAGSAWPRTSGSGGECRSPHDWRRPCSPPSRCRIGTAPLLSPAQLPSAALALGGPAARQPGPGVS